MNFIVDTTFSNSERAISQVEAALASGRQVEINYVYRDFAAAVRGMIERAIDERVGRVVPIDDMARTHFGAQETVFEVLERYADDPRVAIRLWKSLPENKVKRLSLDWLATHALPEIDALQNLGQTVLDEIFAEADRDPHGQWQGLSGDRSLYEAARSKARRGV